MVQFARRYLLPVALLALTVSGCLRSVSPGDIETPAPLALSSSTPYPTAYPTYTLYPTLTEAPFEEPTPIVIIIGQPTETPNLNTGMSDQPTTDPAMMVPTQPIDPRFITATAIVAQHTQVALDMTATALGPVFELPTFTPTSDPFMATPIPAPTQPGTDCIHEVRAGENMYRLSVTYGVQVMDIARASGVFDVERLSIGQRLVIPRCGTTGVVPPSTSTPRIVGTTAPNALGTPIVVTTPYASAGGIKHRIQQGETLFEISRRYGVPMDVIAQANGITNYDQIKFNQELIIP